MGIFSNIFRKKSKGVCLTLDPNGKHTIGGKPSDIFTMPTLDISPILYLGCISKNEPELRLIDFNLHLISPIFLDLRSPIFFDYNNANAPKLITENVETSFIQYFDDIPGSAHIEYEELRFRFDHSKHIDDVFLEKIGHTQTPHWIREEAVPNCPITGNPMKFLFQFSEVDDCHTVAGQDVLDKEYMNDYLNFSHGYFYVFYEPTSKIVAYLNQY